MSEKNTALHYHSLAKSGKESGKEFINVSRNRTILTSSLTGSYQSVVRQNTYSHKALQGFKGVLTILTTILNIGALMFFWRVL